MWKLEFLLWESKHLLIFCNKRLQFWNLRLQNKESGKKEEDGNRAVEILEALVPEKDA